MDLDKARTIHFVGIGGCGMSAIAKILCEMGKLVQGSDSKESSNTIRLKDLGIKIFIGHDASNVRGADAVLYSSAVPAGNVELLAAASSRIPIAQRADALSWILDQFPERITVAGTHGKTTTTSMISTMLSRCEMNPTYIIGAEADTVDGNAKLGNGRVVVAEADESDGTFLKFHPTISVITNIEPDHMEYYGTVENLMGTFARFAVMLSKGGLLVINSDNPNNRTLLDSHLSGLDCIRYGLGPDAEVRALDIKHDRGNSSFEVHLKGRSLGEISLSVPGLQNVANSLAAVAIGLKLGLQFESIRDGLRYFRGVKRRFQTIGIAQDIMIVDDYAHHPTEVAATLKAARLGWGREKRIICVFQPHRYSRTMFLHKEFGAAFSDADIAVITDIYSAGEQPIEGISGSLVADAVRGGSSAEVHYIAKKEKIIDYLLGIARPGDMMITAGAGDIHTVGKEIYARLKDGESQKGKK